MASAAGPVGGLRGKDEIAEVEMETLEPPEAAAARAGLKRARNAAIGNGSYGGLYLHETHGSLTLPDSDALSQPDASTRLPDI